MGYAAVRATNPGVRKQEAEEFFCFGQAPKPVQLPADPRSLTPVLCFFNSSLVMRALAFYNPSNTALKTVVSFIRHLGAQSPEKKGWTNHERVLEH
jgi:hypothetical protein